MIMESTERSIVTGAFSYTGKYITRRLLSMGKNVTTLTGRLNEIPFGDQVVAFPFSFDNPSKLRESLKGATTLYNTYWIRFPSGKITFENAVENTKTLIRAAKEAGIRRFVHISITNASENSSLSYFRGKGLVEKALIDSGLSYAIIRPTIIFGTEDILINNIAWLLRRFPVFAVIGSGNYRVQPVFVEDVAKIAVNASQEDRNLVIDATGPEIHTFDGLVRLIAETIQSRATIIHVRPSIAYFLSRFVGCTVKDVLLTWDEIKGLTSNLLVSEQAPTGETRLSEWLQENAERVGTRYASEVERHYREHRR